MNMMKNLSINQNRCRNSTDDKITRKGYLNSYNCIPYVQEADETVSMVSRAMKDIHLKNTQIKSLRDKQLQCSN